MFKSKTKIVEIDSLGEAISKIKTIKMLDLDFM